MPNPPAPPLCDYHAALRIAGRDVDLVIDGILEHERARLEAKHRPFQRHIEAAQGYRLCVRYDPLTPAPRLESASLRAAPGRGLLVEGPRFRGEYRPDSATLTVVTDAPTAYAPENAMRLLLSHDAIERGGGLFHAAGIAAPDGNGAFLFPGQSEAGKTTLSLKAGRGLTLSDEMPALVRTVDGWSLAATPFWGDMGRGERADALPLRAVVHLAGKNRLEIQPVSAAEARQRLLATIFCYDLDQESQARAVAVCRDLADGLPHFALISGRDEPYASIMKRVEQVLARHAVQSN